MKTEYDQGYLSFGDDHAIVVAGTIAFNTFEEFRGLRKQLSGLITNGSTIDIRDLKFLSSSGRAMFSMVCNDAKRRGVTGVKIWIKQDIEWQDRIITTLRHVWPALTVIGVEKVAQIEFPQLDF